MPFSFRLVGNGQHYQFAASCQAEMQIWINGLHDALAAPAPWAFGEPFPSFHTEGDKSASTTPSSATPTATATPTPATEEGSLEWAGTLPTIQSLNESESAEHHTDAKASSPQLPPTPSSPSLPTPASASRKSRPLSRLDSIGPTAFRQQDQLPAPPPSSFSALSRRSSSHSVKAFFAPMTSSSSVDPTPPARIVRPSSQVRAQVDQGVQDVFSEKCLAARAQAAMRDEELFPKKRIASSNYGSGAGESGVARSNSALSISGAMGLVTAKKRYDSVIASKRKSSIDEAQSSGLGESESNSSFAPGTKSLGSTPLRDRARTLASRRYKKQLPIIVASNLTKVESEAEGENPLVQSPTTLNESPFPASHRSSTASSSAIPSPLDGSLPALPVSLPPPDPSTQRHSDVIIVHPQAEEQYKPKRTRSMVDNVRFFFQSRSASPSPSSASDTASISPIPPPVQPSSFPHSQTTTLSIGPDHLQSDAPPSSFVNWLRRGSLRRRVQSSPEVPGDEPQVVSPTGATASSSASEGGHATMSTSYLLPGKDMDRGGASEPALHTPSAPGRAPANPRRVAFSDATPTRRRSLFSPALTRSREASAPDQPSDRHSMPAFHRKSLRNVLSFQRSNLLTPVEMDASPEHHRSFSDTATTAHNP